jgi:hypothetical protein
MSDPTLVVPSITGQSVPGSFSSDCGNNHVRLQAKALPQIALEPSAPYACLNRIHIRWWDGNTGLQSQSRARIRQKIPDAVRVPARAARRQPEAEIVPAFRARAENPPALRKFPGAEAGATPKISHHRALAHRQDLCVP